MTAFLHLNLPDYINKDQDEEKTFGPRNVCIGCLSKDQQLVNLAECKHTSIFDLFCQFKVDYKTSLMCRLCHHFLKKIAKFKQQVEDSLTKLNKQAQNIQSSKSIYLTSPLFDIGLETSNYELPVKDEPVPSISNDTIDEDFIELTTYIKVEQEDNSDLEIDIPLAVIKKENKKTKKKTKEIKKVTQKKNVTKKFNKPSLSEKYEGKIVIVTLSIEELILEKEKESKKEAYLKLPYKCEHCVRGFDYEATFKDHMKKRHDQKRGGFVCDICKSVLSTETSYKEHTKRHLRRYQCVECGKRNNNVYSVLKHYNEHHGQIDAQFTCQDCGFSFQSHRAYRYHRDKHKEKQRCKLCDSSFVNYAGLKVHMFTVHKKSNRVYCCESCNKVYKAKSGLAAHQAAAHAAPAPAYCAKCQVHFRSAHNLAHHLKTHKNHITDSDKRFICDECGSRYLGKAALHEHINFVHLKTKRFECDKCSKVFKNNPALKKHVNYVHMKIRPPRNKICDHCGRGFTTLHILRSHVRTHTGERPLKCSHCAATFAHSAALYTHNKLLHKKNNQGER